MSDTYDEATPAEARIVRELMEIRSATPGFWTIMFAVIFGNLLTGVVGVVLGCVFSGVVASGMAAAAAKATEPKAAEKYPVTGLPDVDKNTTPGGESVGGIVERMREQSKRAAEKKSGGTP